MSENIIKAEYEADYIMAYRFRNGMADLVFSTDSDMSALCGPSCISIRYFGVKKDKKKKMRLSLETKERKMKMMIHSSHLCSTLVVVAIKL